MSGDLRATGLFLPLPAELIDAIAEKITIRLATDASKTAEPWLGVHEAANYLACSPKRIYDLVATRRLRVARDGRRLLFRRSWLDATLDRRSSPHDEVGSS